MLGESIEINGITYVPASSIPKPPVGDIKIMVLQRGFVYVGHVVQNGDRVTITGAQNIRRWGTVRGLGHLASEGPTPDTVLDPAGTVECHCLGVVLEHICTHSGWEKLCK